MDKLPEANMEVPEGMNSSVCTGGKDISSHLVGLWSQSLVSSLIENISVWVFWLVGRLVYIRAARYHAGSAYDACIFST